jgi:flagellar basal-body rod protein FlgB
MVNSILSTPQEAALEYALSASALRNKVISNNIANVNTPGFKRSDVAFEDMLAEALEKDNSSLSRTNDRHFFSNAATLEAPSVAAETNTSLRTDGNNVDIDTEMANLAKNNIYYDSVAQILKSYFANLQSAIKEGK